MFNSLVSTCRSAGSALSVRLQATALLKIAARGHLQRWLGRSILGTLGECLKVGALLLAGGCRRCLGRRLRPRCLRGLGCQSWHRRGPRCLWWRRRGTEGLERLCWCGLRLCTPPSRSLTTEKLWRCPCLAGWRWGQSQHGLRCCRQQRECARGINASAGIRSTSTCYHRGCVQAQACASLAAGPSSAGGGDNQYCFIPYAAMYAICARSQSQKGLSATEMWGFLALAGGGLGSSGCLSGTSMAGGGARLSVFNGCVGISAGFCSCVCKASKIVNFVRRLVGDRVGPMLRDLPMAPRMAHHKHEMQAERTHLCREARQGEAASRGALLLNCFWSLLLLLLLRLRLLQKSIQM